MAGFFTESELTGTSLPVISSTDRPKCGSCGLYKKCESPKMTTFNRGKDKEILIVSEAPGLEEDKQNKQLAGNTGRELEVTLYKAGINLRKDCSLTYSLICHPKNNIVTDNMQVDYCRPNLIKTIEEENPKVIILLGAKAVRSILPYVWKKDDEEIEKWTGWTIPSQKINAWLCPTYHPAHLFKMKNEMMKKDQLKHLKQAKRLAGKDRPWDNKKMFSEKEIKVLYNTDEIKHEVKKLIKGDRAVAFDYETNCLKPDNSYAEIVCIGISDGLNTISFEINNNTFGIVKDFLVSDVQKLGQNQKFEDRWSKRIFGVWPKNAKWCGMINSHILDNRPGITSVKFQSFVRLGMQGYDEHIKPFLKADGTYAKNRVHEIPKKQLLTYCGMDALLEYWVDNAQMKEAGEYVKDKSRLPI